MAGAHEHAERAEHVEHVGSSSKKIALLISVIALFLAFAETLGKSAQTEALSLNIKSSDHWNFFQAKTVRQTALRAAAEGMAVQATGAPTQELKEAMLKQVETWQKTVARYESDPKEQDGRKELRAKAEKLEHERDTMLAKYHHYEVASAAFQIGIVLASAAVITGLMVLTYLAGALAVAGLAFMAIAILAPHAVHLF
jgi:hypothetical protein